MMRRCSGALPLDQVGLRPAFAAVRIGLVWVGLLWASGVAGQIPGLSGGSQPAPAGAMAPLATARPDTAVVELTGLNPDWAPMKIHAVPDTVLFGGRIHLVVDLPAEAPPAAADSLIGDVPWLKPVAPPARSFRQRIAAVLGRDDETEAVELSNLPASEGRRTVRTWRVYRTDPFRLKHGTWRSDVITVQGRVEGLGQVAEIRGPRILGYDLTVLLGWAALLTLVMLAAWWLWRRRRRQAAILEDWSIPPPAWLSVAVDLRKLLQDDLLARGDGRTFLDRLAGLVRTYVTGRYRIAAREMTGTEIVTACRALGYRSHHPRRFADLLDELDRHRYNPADLDPAWCRGRSRDLFANLAAVRILPHYGSVPADLQLAADKAWSQLEAELGSPTVRRGAAAVSVLPEGGT